MEKSEKVTEIMAIVRGVKPLNSQLPIYEIDEVGNIVSTGETMEFAPIKGGIIVKYPLSPKDKQEMEDIKNGSQKRANE